MVTASKPRSKRAIATFVVAGLVFLIWWISGMVSHTQLVTPVSPILWWLITGSCGLLGSALGYQASRGATKERAAAAIFMAAFTLFFVAIGTSLAERVANWYLFRNQPSGTTRVELPISVVGLSRGGAYVLLHGSSARFTISRGDYALLRAEEQAASANRYCLPITVERAGQDVRVWLPRAPRPGKTRRTITVRQCYSKVPPHRVIG